MSANAQNYAIWIEREQEPETHAVFCCAAPIGLSAEDILARVTAGVTAWMFRSVKGQACIADDTWEFNIGDVALHLSDIAPWLAREGLKKVRVLEPHYLRSEWTWDRRLVDSAYCTPKSKEDLLKLLERSRECVDHALRCVPEYAPLYQKAKALSEELDPILNHNVDAAFKMDAIRQHLKKPCKTGK